MITRRMLKRYIDRKVRDGIRERLAAAGNWAARHKLLVAGISIPIIAKIIVHFIKRSQDNDILSGKTTESMYVREMCEYIEDDMEDDGILDENAEAINAMRSARTINEFLIVLRKYGLLDKSTERILLHKKALFEQRKLYRNSGLTGAVNSMYNPREI